MDHNQYYNCREKFKKRIHETYPNTVVRVYGAETVVLIDVRGGYFGQIEFYRPMPSSAEEWMALEQATSAVIQAYFVL